MVGGRWGWRTTFAVIVLAALAALAILATTLPNLPGAPRQPLATRLAPLARPAIARLVLAVFLCGTGGLMFYTYLAPLLAQAGLSRQHLPLVLLEVGVIGVPSAFLGGWLADTYGARRARLVVIGGHVIALAILAALVAADVHWPLLIVAIALWSVFAWALNPPLQASTMQAAPDSPMAAVALNISGLYLGTAAAAALGGLLADDPRPAWIPPAATILLVLAWLSASRRTEA